MKLKDNQNVVNALINYYDCLVSKLEKEIVDLNDKNIDLYIEKEGFKNQFFNVINSNSWKITEPLRKLKDGKAQDNYISSININEYEIKLKEAKKRIKVNENKIKITNQDKNLLSNSFKNKKPRIAIQVHVYYPQYIKEINDKLSNLQYPYDLYVSVCEEKYKDFIKFYFTQYSNAKNVYVKVFKNKGRDVIPFIEQLKDKISKYEFICHIHTKKSTHGNIGNDWRQYSFNHLLGSEKVIDNVLSLFIKNDKIGILYPAPYFISDTSTTWTNNYDIACKLMKRINKGYILPKGEITFPVGNMFWAKTNAIKEIFKLDIKIPKEKGQTDGTVLHAIERLWSYVAFANGYDKIDKLLP